MAGRPAGWTELDSRKGQLKKLNEELLDAQARVKMLTDEAKVVSERIAALESGVATVRPDGRRERLAAARATLAAAQVELNEAQDTETAPDAA